jgi:hypothetical protein
VEAEFYEILANLRKHSYTQEMVGLCFIPARRARKGPSDVVFDKMMILLGRAKSEKRTRYGIISIYIKATRRRWFALRAYGTTVESVNGAVYFWYPK